MEIARLAINRARQHLLRFFFLPTQPLAVAHLRSIEGLQHFLVHVVTEMTCNLPGTRQPFWSRRTAGVMSARCMRGGRSLACDGGRNAICGVEYVTCSGRIGDYGRRCPPQVIRSGTEGEAEHPNKAYR